MTQLLSAWDLDVFVSMCTATIYARGWRGKLSGQFSRVPSPAPCRLGIFFAMRSRPLSYSRRTWATLCLCFCGPGKPGPGMPPVLGSYWSGPGALYFARFPDVHGHRIRPVSHFAFLRVLSVPGGKLCRTIFVWTGPAPTDCQSILAPLRY